MHISEVIILEHLKEVKGAMMLLTVIELTSVAMRK